MSLESVLVSTFVTETMKEYCPRIASFCLHSHLKKFCCSNFIARHMKKINLACMFTCEHTHTYYSRTYYNQDLFHILTSRFDPAHLLHAFFRTEYQTVDSENGLLFLPTKERAGGNLTVLHSFPGASQCFFGMQTENWFVCSMHTTCGWCYRIVFF